MRSPQPWPFGSLKMFGYQQIMIDPPWPFEHRSERGEEKSFKRHYGEMSIDDIKALRIGELAMAPAMIKLWCCSPTMPHAYDVLDAWGFRYGFTGTWVKQTKHGKTAFIPGYLHRGGAEFFLVGFIGHPPIEPARERNVIFGMVREHSRKPEEAYAWCERYFPSARRVELFSRATRPGWDTWGYEAGKFDPVVSVQEKPPDEPAQPEAA